MTIIDDSINEVREELDEGIWKGEHKYKWIKTLSPKTKGSLAEKIYCSFAKNLNCKVDPPLNSDHDCIIDCEKDEAKLSTICKNGKTFTFFQIRQFQDYDNLVFICVFPYEIEIWKITSDDFMDYIEKNPKEQTWAGGVTKRKKLNSNIMENDLFHWLKPVNKKWPDKARRLL